MCYFSDVQNGVNANKNALHDIVQTTTAKPKTERVLKNSDSDNSSLHEEHGQYFFNCLVVLNIVTSIKN